MDYQCEGGAKRNFEVWRQKDPDANDEKETEEERLERLEREEEERGAMANLETKVLDAKREMEIADALDEIRTRNARNERARGRDVGVPDKDEIEAEKERIAREDDEMARRAFMTDGGERVRRIGDEDAVEDGDGAASDALGRAAPVEGLMAPPPPPPPTFKRVVKKKKDLAAALGIRKKAALV